MTYAKVDDRFITDERMLALSRGARLLYLEGIVWCCQHLTDGRIPAHVLARISDEPDLDAAIADLVAAGLWSTRHDGAYDVVGFLDPKQLGQSSREYVEKMRDDNRTKQERSRRHKANDHSLCIKGRYCPAGEVTRNDTGDQPGQSRQPLNSTPLRRHSSKGGSGSGSAANAAYAPGEGAPAARRGWVAEDDLPVIVKAAR